LSPADVPSVADEIKQVIERINRAWREGRFDEIGPCFHSRAVIVPPGFGGRVEGARACVKSYRDFTAAAKIQKCEERDFAVDTWGDTAVVSYRFEISYDMQGRRYDETGRDLMVLSRRDGRWRVVWRTLLSSPGQS